MSGFHLLSSPLAGRHLIDASAGTGKTYTISALVVRLLLEAKLPLEKILIVTYTEAATADLKARVRKMIVAALAAFTLGHAEEAFLRELLDREVIDHELARQNLAAALRDFDLAAIFTIHGFCRRMLVDNSLESGVLFDTELVTDLANLNNEVARDYYRRVLYQAPPLFVRYCRVGKKITVAGLVGLLTGYGAHAALQIIPALAHDRIMAGLEPLIAGYEQQFLSLAGLWRQSAQEVGRILLESKALNRNSYRVTSIEKWLVLAGDFFAGKAQLPFEDLAKFTETALAGATKNGQETPGHEFFRCCGEFMAIVDQVREFFEQAVISLKREFLLQAQAELAAEKAQRNIFGFDDLLKKLHQGLMSANGRHLADRIRAKFPAALIDEFQDTDPLQYGIFTAIYPAGEAGVLYLIGDPKQAIYSFRGADIFAYIKATRDVSDRYTLDRNWRASPGLITAVNTIFNQGQTSFIFEEIVFEPVRPAEAKVDRAPLLIDGTEGPPFQLWLAGREIEEQNRLIPKGQAREMIARAVASEVARLLTLGVEGRARLGERGLRPADIAVLVGTNAEARLIQKELAARQVASVLHATENLFDAHEAKELRILLAALAEPGNLTRMRTALATNFVGFDAVGLEGLANDENALAQWLTRFGEYHDLWQRDGFMRMIRYFFGREQVRPRLLSLDMGERRMTNLLHLTEILHRAELEGDLAMTGILKFLDDKIDSAAEEKIEEYQLRLESDADRVQVVTIHKAKGLEYQVVFCPFLWRKSGKKKPLEYLFHGRSRENSLTLDLGSADFDESARLAGEERLAEELRLSYVALTRARERCYLVWGPFADTADSGLCRLLHGTGRDFAGLSDSEIFDDLAGIAKESEGRIQISSLGEVNYASQFVDQPSCQPDQLSCPSFSRRLESAWRVASFSSLISGKTPARTLIETTAAKNRPEPSRLDIFSFPQGAAAGNFFHDLLEHAEFDAGHSDANDQLIKQKLNQYGYGAQWHEAIAGSLRNIFQTPLGPEGPCLRQISRSARVHEMEFYFPLAGIGAIDPAAWFASLPGPAISRLVEVFHGLNLRDLKGFMKGFVDLVFVKDGRYYIVDWKSNFLGASIDHYTPERLMDAMIKDLYVLQYSIYTVALHLHLAARLPGYRYEDHFGGVYYLFLRGIDQRRGPGYGMFHDRPTTESVVALTSCLTGDVFTEI